jgi:NAD(P)-dependent dehydrogenase (short-subunit alcohol dehydrogenase family)
MLTGIAPHAQLPSADKPPRCQGRQCPCHATPHRDGTPLDPAGALGPGTARGPGDAGTGNRVAVVTGGSRGFGLALVRMLAQRGLRVVMASRSSERGRAALASLGDLADSVAVRPVDITAKESVTGLAWWLGQQLGRCDILVNAASVQIDDMRGSLDVDMDIVRRTLETNLLGTWQLAQAITPLMRRRRYGRIVNISNGFASLPPGEPHLPAYRVSQMAINSLTRILAGELADDGVLVNACSPGPLQLSISPSRDVARLTLSAETALWLATLPDDGPTGGFFRDRKAVSW